MNSPRRPPTRYDRKIGTKSIFIVLSPPKMSTGKNRKIAGKCEIMSSKAKKLPSGNWRVNLYIGTDSSGKRRFKSFTRSTKRDAELAAAAYAIENKPEELAPSYSLADAYERYIASKDAVLSPTTIAEYKRIRRTHLQDLMPRPLQSITAEDVQLAVNELARNHSPKTVRNIHGLLSAVLREYRPGFTLHTTLPQKDKTELHIPSEGNIVTMYGMLRGTPLELPFLLASQLGLRASEISGLQYGDVDFKAKTVTVRRARVHAGNQLQIKRPKSTSGHRVIPCPDVVLRLIGAGEGGSADFVVPLGPDKITRQWAHFITRNKLPHCRFHDLRHYFASAAMLQGIPQRYIAEMMGHASLQMLEQVYQHTFPDKKAEYQTRMANRADDLFRDRANMPAV